MYVVGDFTAVGATPRNRIAESTGRVSGQTFDPAWRQRVQLHRVKFLQR